MNNLTVIHCYSRAQAIADGVLIDVTEMAKEAGFYFPVALTHAVWCSCVEVPPGVEGQDEKGRLWDILIMLRFAIQHRPRGTELLFQLHVRNDNRNATPPLISLKAVCGPNDDETPCLTIMEPNED
jgi:hypothetical protein